MGGMDAHPSINRVMWFFAIVYAVEGIGQAKSGIMWQPLSYYLKQVQHWDPVKISVSLAVLDVPWIIKPLWGGISDFIPIFGYRRRPYLIIANIAGTLAFAALALSSDTATMIPLLTVTALAMAISSTLCGALLVETGQRLHASAKFVNQQWLWFNIAQMLTTLLAGYLIEVFTPVGAFHAAAWFAAAAPLAILGSIWLVREPRASIDLPALRGRMRALVSAFKDRNLWFVGGFLFLYYFSPGFGTPLYFQMTDRLHFSQGFIGLLSSISAGALHGVAEARSAHGPAEAQHCRRRGDDPDLPVARRSRLGRRDLAGQRRGRDDRHGRDHVARRRCLPARRRGLRLRRADVHRQPHQPAARHPGFGALRTRLRPPVGAADPRFSGGHGSSVLPDAAGREQKTGAAGCNGGVDWDAGGNIPS